MLFLFSYFALTVIQLEFIKLNILVYYPVYFFIFNAFQWYNFGRP